MKIRNVEDARKNLERVLKDAREGKPIDPKILKAAEAAIERMKANVDG
jgi:hypothetical protein